MFALANILSLAFDSPLLPQRAIDHFRQHITLHLARSQIILPEYSPDPHVQDSPLSSVTPPSTPQMPSDPSSDTYMAAVTLLQLSGGRAITPHVRFDLEPKEIGRDKT